MGNLHISEDFKNVISSTIYSYGNDYIKFENGIMLCFANTQTKNCPHGATDFDITLPQSYLDQNFSIIVAKRLGGSYWANALEHAFPVSNDSLRIGVWNDSPNTAENVSYNLLTIGKWK